VCEGFFPWGSMSAFDLTMAPIERLLRFWLRFVIWSLRMAPFLLVVAAPVTVVVDRCSPWLPALQELSVYGGQCRACVGISGEEEGSGAQAHVTISRSFLLFPRVFTAPSLISVTATDGAATTVESGVTFWLFLTLYAGAVVYCFRYFRGPRPSRHAGGISEPS